ncbi:MAG: ABC transporter permease [Bacteroidota bacterium]
MSRILFELWEGLLIALRAVRGHKLRAVLTTLGIIIGITSVTSMATVIAGLERDFDQEMNDLGTDVIYIDKWPWVTGPNFKWWDVIRRPEITPELADVIEARSRYATAAAPVVETNRNVRRDGVSLSRVNVQASTPDFVRIQAVDLAEGRFYNDLDVRSARLVAVVGHTIAERLFPVESAVGKNIRVGGQRFQVIGVKERKGTSAEGASDDTRVHIPLTTFGNLYGLRDRSVTVQVKLDAEDLDLAKDEVVGILRVARKLDALDPNDFEINEQASIREQLAPIKTAIYGIGIFLTALSLLVGGIGVMNIMFVSVKERTKEIGIRKAIGARRRTIMIQFLIESVFVCLIGGVIGVLISGLIAALISTFLPAYLPPATVALAFGICMFIGLVFGAGPAWTAAKAEPIEALRYE